MCAHGECAVVAGDIARGVGAPGCEGVRRVEAAEDAGHAPERFGNCAVDGACSAGIERLCEVRAEGFTVIEGREEQRARGADYVHQGMHDRRRTADHFAEAAQRRVRDQTHAGGDAEGAQTEFDFGLSDDHGA